MHENEADFTDQFVPTYVNAEPVVLAGLTDIELISCVVGAVTISLFSSVAIGFFWLGFLAFFLFIVAAPLLGFLFAKILRDLKQGKPKGYINAKLRYWAARWFGVGKLYLIDQPLKVGRSNQLIVVVKGVDEQ